MKEVAAKTGGYELYWQIGMAAAKRLEEQGL
jgi:hypothetical protein